MLDFYQTQHTVRWWRQNQSVVRQCQIADRTLYTLITSVRCLTKPLLINVLSRHATACPTTSVFKMASLNSKRYKMRHFSREMLNKNAWEEDIVSAVQRLVPRLACSEGCRTTRNCNLRHFSGRIGRSVVIHCGWLGSKHQLSLELLNSLSLELYSLACRFFEHCLASEWHKDKTVNKSTEISARC